MTAERAEESLKNLLLDLPQDHQDWTFLSGLVEVVASYNKKPQIDSGKLQAESLRKEPVTSFTKEQRSALAERAKKENKELAIYEIQPKSLASQLAENPDYFGYVNESLALRDLVEPVSFEAAVFVDKKTKRGVPIPESNRLPLDKQKEIIEGNYNRKLKVRGVKAIMVHAYVDTQLDIEHQKQTGRKFLDGFYARTPDETFGSDVADVGRINPGNPLHVYDGDRDYGDDDVFAFPVVVPNSVEI